MRWDYFFHQFSIIIIVVTNQPSTMKKAMLIPLNTPSRQDLCLSVLCLKDGQRTTYSVTVMEIVNGVGFDSLPGWRKLLPDDDENRIYPVACITEFDVVTGPDLYKCIEECMKQVTESCIK